MEVSLDFGGAVVVSLPQVLPKVWDSNDHVVTDNFFTSPSLLKYLKENAISDTGPVRSNGMIHALSKLTVDVGKS